MVFPEKDAKDYCEATLALYQLHGERSHGYRFGIVRMDIRLLKLVVYEAVFSYCAMLYFPQCRDVPCSCDFRKDIFLYKGNSMNEQTSIAAIAELIENEIAPKPGSYNKIDIEDIVEKVRNSYSGVLWQLYMQNLNDSSRLINTVLTARKSFAVGKDTSSIILEGIQVVDLPRDAGIYAVVTNGPACKRNGLPMIRSTPAAAYETKSRIPIRHRYYRIGTEMFFPDGLPAFTDQIVVVFYGLLEDNEEMYISRTVADLVHKQVKDNYAATLQVPSDVTPNLNPNV